MLEQCWYMQENKRKLCVWVPEELYKEVLEAGYDKPTYAVTEGFKLLAGAGKTDVCNFFLNRLLNSSDDDINNYIGSLKSKKMVDPTLVPTLLAKNKELKKEVEKLTEALQKAQNPVELVELRANVIGLQKLLEEKDKRIEDLTKLVEMLNVFANYFKILNQNK